MSYATNRYVLHLAKKLLNLIGFLSIMLTGVAVLAWPLLLFSSHQDSAIQYHDPIISLRWFVWVPMWFVGACIWVALAFGPLIRDAIQESYDKFIASNPEVFNS